MVIVAELENKIDYAFDEFVYLTNQAAIHRGLYEGNKDSSRFYAIVGGLKSTTLKISSLELDVRRN